MGEPCAPNDTQASQTVFKVSIPAIRYCYPGLWRITHGPLAGTGYRAPRAASYNILLTPG